MLSSNIVKCDDHKLAAWLRKIYPIVDKELLKCLTPVEFDEFECDATFDQLNVTPHQVVSTKTSKDHSNVAEV